MLFVEETPNKKRLCWKFDVSGLIEKVQSAGNEGETVGKEGFVVIAAVGSKVGSEILMRLGL